MLSISLMRFFMKNKKRNEFVVEEYFLNKVKGIGKLEVFYECCSTLYYVCG